MSDVLPTLRQGRSASRVIPRMATVRACSSDGVVFAPVCVSGDSGPPLLILTTGLAVRNGASSRRLRPLLDACAEAAAIDLES